MSGDTVDVSFMWVEYKAASTTFAINGLIQATFSWSGISFSLVCRKSLWRYVGRVLFFKFMMRPLCVSRIQMKDGRQFVAQPPLPIKQFFGSLPIDKARWIVILPPPLPEDA